jgi:hypothetical protein
MYAMKAVTSSIFRTIMFPHNGKIVTVDQLTHYEPNPSASVDNILPLIHTNQDVCPFIEMGLGMFKDPSLLGTYHGAPPLLHPHQVCGVFPLKTLSQRILFLHRRLQSSLTSHQSQHHSHRSLLQTRRPP